MNVKKNFSRRIFIILLHLLAWALFIFYPFIFYQIKVIGSEFYYKQIINAVFLAGVFYFCTYYLFPRIIKRKRLFRNLLVALAIIIFIPLQQYYLELYFFKTHIDRIQIISPLSKVEMAEFGSAPQKKEIKVFIARRDSLPLPNVKFNIPLPSHISYIPATLQKSLSSLLFVLLLSGFVSVVSALFRTEKQKKELENQRLNAELAFLKSQVNPHFFFNTLNTIYLLAHKKSDQTEQVVVKLSEIMRYMIYESNGKEVSLSREIKYLEDYIDLQKLRLSKKVDVQFFVEGNPDMLPIAPMLLIPFIENAFKHGISYAEKSYIHIHLSIQQDSVVFSIRNKLFPKKDELEKPTGVGLENVKKRLLLLYPEKHELAINQENNEFLVTLKIQLKHDPVHSS